MKRVDIKAGQLGSFIVQFANICVHYFERKGDYMILKQYSKLALVAVAAVSLSFAGCGGKKDDAAMSGHAGGDMEKTAAMDSNANNMGNAQSMKNMAAKPSTNSVYFDFNSSAINAAGNMILTGYAAWLNANSDVNITIEGNADERGSREYNLALGEQRAKAVRSALIANGVAASRVDTVSYGEERPVCSRSGEACWAQNRHGDIVNR